MPAQLPGRRHATRRDRPVPRRGWPLAASVAFAVIAVAGAVAVVLHQPGRAGPRADAATARQPAIAAAAPCAHRTAATPCPQPLATADHPAPNAPSAGPAARRTGAVAAHQRRTAGPGPAATTAATTAAPGTTAPITTAPSTTAPAGAQPLAIQQVLALINTARTGAGRLAYTMTGGLDTSAGRHNAVMAAGCGLSHQCPGEPALGARESAAGVHWTAAGENIGEGGPVADTPTAIAQMAVTLTQSMLNEKPPDDGHRLNILSSSFTHIGIAVYRDSSGTVWMTQDFSN